MVGSVWVLLYLVESLEGKGEGWELEDQDR